MYILILAKRSAETDFRAVKHIPSWIPGNQIKKHLIEGKQAREEAFIVPYKKVQQERVRCCLSLVIFSP